MDFDFSDLPDLNTQPGKQPSSEFDFSDLPDLGTGSTARPERTVLGTLGDAANVAAQGVVGAGETVVGLGNIATGGALGQFMENNLGYRPKETRKILDDTLKSDAQRYADAEFQNAEGFGGKFKAAIQNPSVIASAAGESIPSMFLGGAAAKGLGAVSKLGNLSRAAIGEGAVSAGASAESIRQQSGENTTWGQMATAVGSGALVGLLGVAGGKVAQKLGIDDADQLVAGFKTADAATKKSMARRVIEGAVSEGVVEEIPQSAVETMAENMALERPLMQGIEESVVLGGLAGGVIGGGAQVLRRRPAEQAPPQADTTKISPDFVSKAFMEVGGAGETVDEMRQARGLVAASLSQMDDQEAAQAISAISGGNEQLAQQLSAARQDQELIQVGKETDGDSVESFMAVNHMLRADAGLVQHDEGDQEAVTQFLSQRFPTVFAQQAPQSSSPGVMPATSSSVSPATPAAPLQEPVAELQAQVQAVKEGRKPAVFVDEQQAQTLDVNGLAQGTIQGPAGNLYIFAPTNEAVNAVVTRASEVGVEQAMGEALGYAQPGVSQGVPTAAVQQIDNATGQVIQEEVVTPEAAGSVNRIPDTSVRVAPVGQVLAERGGALQSAPVAQEASQTTQTIAKPAVSGQSTAVDSAPSTPVPDLEGQEQTKALPTTVPPQTTAVPKSKPVSELVRRLNAANKLEGGAEINESSIVEVKPSTLKDKGEQRRMRQLKQAVKTAFGVDLVIVDTPSGSLMRKDGTKFNTFIGVADQEAKRVFLNRKAATPLNTMAHELVHILETSFPEAYAKLEDVVLSRVRYGAFRRLKAGLQSALEAESKGSSDAQRLMAELRSEIVAEAVGEMGQSPQLWAEMFSGLKDQTQVKRLYDAIIEVIGRLAKAFTREGYIDGLKDMQAVRKAVTEAFVQWSVKESQQDQAGVPAAGPVESRAKPAVTSPTEDQGRRAQESDKEFAKRVIDKRPKPKSLPEDHGAYFTLPAGTVIVPIDKIASTKTDSENEQGAENGAKRMAAAAAGELSKRAPITVMPSETVEGGYDIVDGNGSYSSIKSYGWKTLPVTVVPRKKGKRSIKIDKAKELAEKHLPKPLVKEMVAAVENADDIPDNPAFLAKKAEAEAFMEPLLKKAAEANKQYQDEVSKLAKEIGARAESGPLKKADRSAYKLWETAQEQGRDWAADDIKDLARASIVVDSETAVPAAIKAVRGKFNVIRIKDRFTKPLPTGYRDVLINVQLENGSIAELQIHLPEIYDAKELGHIAYEAERQLPAGSDAQAALQKLQKRYYEAAYALAAGRASQAATKASNSSAVAGAPFSTTLENRTGLPVNAAKNPPSTEPTTGEPSTSNIPLPGLAASTFQSNPDTLSTSDGSVLREGSGTYVSRKVLNGDAIHAWAKYAGIKDVVPADKMHVTLAYSRTPIGEDALKAKTHPVIVGKGDRSLEQFDDGAIVLRIESDQLQSRWKELIDSGATWDFGHYEGAYKPHVTLSYEKQDVDLGKIKPFDGPVVLAGEKSEGLKTNYSEEIKAEIDGLVKFSRKDIAKAIKGDLSGNPMEFLAAPTEEMLRYGILGRSLPVAIVPDVINKIGTGKDRGRGSNRTPMTPEQIESLPDYVRNPAAVFDDPSDKDSLVFMTSMVMDDTDPVVVAIGKRPVNNRLPVKMIGGALRKTAFSNVNTAFQKGWDKFGSWMAGDGVLKMVDPSQIEAAVENGMPKRLARALREAALGSKGRVYVVGGSAALDRIAYPIGAMTASGVQQQPSELPSTTAKPTITLPAGSVNPVTGKKILGVKKVLPQRENLVRLTYAGNYKNSGSWTFLNPPPKPKGKVLSEMIGEAFDRLAGGRKDWTSQIAQGDAVDMGAAEVAAMLREPKSGLDWYEEDIKKAFDTTIKVIPSLAAEQKRRLFSVMAAIMSPQTNARDNWNIAAKGFQHYEETGTIPGMNPETGGYWQGGTTSVNKAKQLNMLDAMVKDIGEEAAVEWIHSEHTVKELNDARRKWGNMGPSVAGKMTDKALGFFAFGPKVGPFAMNLNGIHEVTVDMWMTRTFNRWMGAMLDDSGKMIDAPTEPQRRVIKDVVQQIADRAGIKPYQVQSVLWFFEQGLFKRLGSPVESYGFSDGAAKFAGGAAAADNAGNLGGVEAVRSGDEAAGGNPAGEGRVLADRDLTDTPEFKAWFGDSKVVDENGEPLVVYHGTAADITEFNVPAYFTDYEEEANFYATGTYYGVGSRVTSDSVVYPVYLSIKNPVRLGDAWDSRSDALSASKIKRWRAAGYDGAVGEDSNSGAMHWIAFKPEQIKSATGNSGAFGGTSPDIRFSRTLADDIEAQSKWLEEKAKAAGYKDIDALAESDYDQFVELAQEWRQDHPAEALFSRPLKVMSAQEVMDMARTGKMPYNLDDAVMRGQMADAYMLAKNADQRSRILSKIGDWAIETFADSMISVRRWIDRLPLSATLKQRMTGDLYRAATLRSAMQKEVKELFTEPMFREMEKAAKATGLTSDQVKVLSGYWMTAKYAPKANAFLLAKDNTALLLAMQTGDAKLIAQAQQNVADRTADITGAVGAPRTRGVAGGFNDAEAAQTVRDIEAKIPRQLLDDISKHVYDMLAWKKAKDLSSGRISQAMVNSWPNHRDYVPLTGDPRFSPESEDVFTTGGQLNQDKDKALNGRKESISDDAVDATYEAVVKSINFAGIQDFKRSLAKAYDDAQAAGIDIGVKREPITGIVRTSDDVVIYRDTYTAPNGLITTRASAYKFDDQKVIQALKRDNEEQLNALLSAVATPTRWYGKLVTQFMPMFAPINFIRDMWERSELVRTRKLYDSNGNQINTDKVARAAIAASLSPQLWKGSLDSNFKTSKQSQERADLEEMIKFGGSSVWGDYLARNAGDIEAELRTSFGKVAGAARKANSVVENYNNTFEMIAPLSIYRALKAEGMEAKDAAAAVLDLMNFKKRGVAMPAIRALYVFAQPAATSGYNLAQYLSTRKGQIRFAAQLLIGTALYAFLKGLWGDDEDELGNRLDNLSNFTVERTIPIPIGDKVFKIPVGFGAPQLAWAASGILNRLASGRYDTPTAVGELFKGWVKSVSPVAPSEMEIAKNPAAWAAMSFTPTVLRPLMSIGMNQTPFGQPLRPQFLDPDKFRSDQSKRTTPQLYKDIATEIREATGVDMYPDNIKALVDGWLIGPARELTSFFIENPAKEVRGEPGKVIGISSVLDNVNDRQLLNSMYYRAREEAEEANREYEARLKDGTLMDWMTPEKMAQVSAYKRMEKVERRMGSLRGQLTKQSRFMDPETLASRTQQIEEQVDQARRGLLKEMVK